MHKLVIEVSELCEENERLRSELAQYKSLEAVRKSEQLYKNITGKDPSKLTKAFDMQNVDAKEFSALRDAFAQLFFNSFYYMPRVYREEEGHKVDAQGNQIDKTYRVLIPFDKYVEKFRSSFLNNAQSSGAKYIANAIYASSLSVDTFVEFVKPALRKYYEDKCAELKLTPEEISLSEQPEEEE